MTAGFAHRCQATALLLLFIGGCTGTDETAIECDGRRVEMNALVTAAIADQSELAPERRAAETIRRQLVRCAVLSQPPDAEEAARLERLNRWNRARECSRIEIKRRLSLRDDFEAQARARFEEDPRAFLQPESFRLQLIFIPGIEPSGEGLARTLLERVQENPSEFAELARTHSKSETSTTGGMTQPMPGTTVHPAMRKAIELHHESRVPFLVTTENGWFVARVLEYWPPVDGSWEEVAAKVTQYVAQQAITDEIRNLVAQIGDQHEISVERELFLHPLVRVDTPVYTFDGRSISVADLMPGVDRGSLIPGPEVGAAVAAFRRWFEPSVVLGCLDNTANFEDDQLFGSRIIPAMSRFAENHMKEEIQQFAETHFDVLVSEERLTFDLWLLPFRSENPFDDLQHYRPVLEEIRSGGDSPGHGDVSRFMDIEMTESQLAGYEPALANVFNAMEPGMVSEPIRSRRLARFVVARLDQKVDERPLSLGNENDRRRIITYFIADSRDLVLDTFATHLESECRVPRGLESRLTDKLQMRLTEAPY